MPFNKTNLHKLLTNPLYVGKVKYKTELHKGEYQPLITEERRSAVQKQLSLNGTTGGAKVRNKFGALLKGLLHCSVCKRAMSPSHSTKGNRRYRYYVCTNAQKTGWSNCPAKSTPALGIENFVVQQIRNVGSDPNLITETLEMTNKNAKEELANLDSELPSLKRDVKAWTKELPTATAGRQADLHERMAAAEKRASDLHEARAKVLVIDPQEVAATR
ncbi:MAG: recombinase zinc beta ribbon domain-containing protein [Pirellulaceae bacterium]|nr:recombinase zinc beta ribbon domain-containing protein [Pirellulaceae bacterium]